MLMIGFTMATAAVYATLYCVVVAMISREEGKKKLVMAIPLIPLLFMTLMSRSFEPGTFMGEHGSTLCLVIAVVLMAINYAISKPNVKSLPTIIDAFENGGKNCLSVGIACGMAGIIAGVVTMTGLGQVLIGAIVGLSNGHLIIALVLTMLCCIVLGMGVPTTANYIIMATTCAPILASGMGLNLMAAHMFCFYFGIVADITPPVALAAYAGSAIAKAPPMKTAWNATRLAIAAFIIPYIFAYNNALIFVGSDVNFLSVASIVISATLGMASIAAGLMGYLIRDMKAISRVALVIGGLLMVIPGTVTDLASRSPAYREQKGQGRCVRVTQSILRMKRDRFGGLFFACTPFFKHRLEATGGFAHAQNLFEPLHAGLEPVCRRQRQRGILDESAGRRARAVSLRKHHLLCA